MTTGPGTLTSQIYYDSLDPARLALCKGALTGPFAGCPYAWLVDPSYINYSSASRAQAATLLGWSRATFYRRFAELGLPEQPRRRI